MRFFAVLLVGMAVTLTGCETDEDNAIAKAQDCLNKSSGAAAASCRSHVSGFTSENSYIIRCSIDFVVQGFDDPAAFGDAFDAMKNNSGNEGSPMLAMLGQLSFTGANALADANTAFSDCKQSGSDGMITFASLVLMSTTIASLVPGPMDGDLSEAEMADALETMTNADDATLGASAIAANEAYCKEGGSHEDSDICTDLAAATAGGSTPEEIGAALRCQMAAEGKKPAGCP